MKPISEGSDTILEFECHLDIQADSSNNVAANRQRMKIQTEQNKPHKKSIAQEFTISFTIINLLLQQVTNRKNSIALGRNSNLPSGSDYI